MLLPTYSRESPFPSDQLLTSHSSKTHLSINTQNHLSFSLKTEHFLLNISSFYVVLIVIETVFAYLITICFVKLSVQQFKKIIYLCWLNLTLLKNSQNITFHLTWCILNNMFWPVRFKFSGFRRGEKNPLFKWWNLRQIYTVGRKHLKGIEEKYTMKNIYFDSFFNT